jgi:hypothetical protein
MSVLTLSNSEVLRLCNLDTADSTNIADATEVIGKGQDSYEAMLQPEALATVALQPFFRRNLSKLIAADLLDMRRRADGASSSLVGAGITVGKPDDLGANLRREAGETLGPYVRIWRPASASTTTDTSPAAQESQGSLFGDSEAARRSAQELGF